MSSNRPIVTEVFKAKLDLGSLSVQEFSTALTDAIMAQFYSSAQWVWIEQLYGDRVIVYVSSEGEPSKYFEHTFEREDDGSFTLGQGAEVVMARQFVRV